MRKKTKKIKNRIKKYLKLESSFFDSNRLDKHIFTNKFIQIIFFKFFTSLKKLSLFEQKSQLEWTKNINKKSKKWHSNS